MTIQQILLADPLTAPVWVTASGSLGSPYTEQTPSFTVTATGAVSYSIVSGSLPTGLTLNTTTGVISGTIGATAVANYTTSTFNFTIRATNGLDEDRAFSLFVQSRFVGYSCFSGNENSTLSGTAPSGNTFNRVDFSSYGNPGGSCGAFTIGSCNSTSSNAYNPTPTTSFSIGATNANWGDPCDGVNKSMRLQLSYGPF